MAYEKQNFTEGQVLTAAALNEMENAIAEKDPTYTKQNFTEGQVLTAEALNKMDDAIVALYQKGGNELVDGIVRTPAILGSSGDLYVDTNAFTIDELDTLLQNTKEKYQTEMNNSRAEMLALIRTTTNIGIVINGSYLQTLDYNTFSGRQIYRIGEGFIGEFVDPILSDVEIGENTIPEGLWMLYSGECPELANKLLYIGKKELKLVANADITSEQLNELNTVEVVTKTETKVFGGSTGGSTGGVPNHIMDIPHNNPNITNIYYGMPIDTNSTVKINVIDIINSYLQLNYHVYGCDSLETFCENGGDVNRLLASFSSQYGGCELFKINGSCYYDNFGDGFYGDNLTAFDVNGTMSISLSIEKTDDNKYSIKVHIYKSSSDSYPVMFEKLINESTNLYNALVNDYQIEFNMIDFFSNYYNHNIDRKFFACYIHTVFGNTDLNDFEKFDGIIFE